ncbi:MAG: sigma-54-dependent Fis family transcriptional regulator [Bacteroidales bacterium]|nr:MAG: sigma-54-dependent Fis family transcriptional regulator [Bacteroidales bacterium]
MIKGKILVVDDNPNVCSAIEMLLQEEFEKIDIIHSPKNLLNRIEKEEFDTILLDMNFTSGQKNGNEGLFWLSKIIETNPSISVIMVTAYGDVELAVKALKLGAIDFVLKPWENEKLVATVLSAVKLSKSKKEITSLKDTERILRNELKKEPCLFIGKSPEFLKVMNLIRKVAATDANVLITGENGTGKELIARELHRLSHRYNQLMVTVDMGAVSETLFESELFGHTKGAFTDARDDRSGKFEAANNGTLFLDEIGNLPLPLQSKLLVAIQNRAVTRLGSNKSIPIDIRLISATNRNLNSMIIDGQFREDLFFRINTIHIEIPPLRQRIEDIPDLAGFFIKKYSSKYGKEGLSLTPNTIDKLITYQWPGNVRELQHTIEKAVILCDGKSLTPNDFLLKPISSETLYSIPETFEEMEKVMIIKAIDKNRGNLTAAAEQLGIARQTFYNKLKKYNIS